MSICILFYKMMKLLSKGKKKSIDILGKEGVSCEGVNLRPGEWTEAEPGGGLQGCLPSAGAGDPSPHTHTGYREGRLELSRDPILSAGTSCLSRVELLNRDFRP